MFLSLFSHRKYVCSRELPVEFIHAMQETFLHPRVHHGEFNHVFEQEHEKALKFNDTLTKFLIDWEITRKEANELKIFFRKNRDRFIRSYPEYTDVYDDMCDMLYLLIRHFHKNLRFHH